MLQHEALQTSVSCTAAALIGCSPGRLLQALHLSKGSCIQGTAHPAQRLPSHSLDPGSKEKPAHKRTTQRCNAAGQQPGTTTGKACEHIRNYHLLLMVVDDADKLGGRIEVQSE